MQEASERALLSSLTYSPFDSQIPPDAEHALCWKLAQSTMLGKLYCLPGNAGIADVATCVSGIGVADVPKVTALGPLSFAEQRRRTGSGHKT